MAQRAAEAAPPTPGRTHLSVGKDGGIVAFEAALDELLHALRVDALLRGLEVEDEVEREGLVLAQEDLRLPGRDRGADVTSFNPLLGKLGSDSGWEEKKEPLECASMNATRSVCP